MGRPAKKSLSSCSDDNTIQDFVQEGVKVLAYDRMSPLLYEATIIKIEEKPEVYYFVHYTNWSKKWDEWVKPSRVMELNDANKKYAEKIKMDHMKGVAAEKKKRKSLGTQDKAEPVSATKSKKQQQQQPTKKAKKTIEVNLSIPFSLKKQLVLDYENIVKKGQLVSPLPRAPSVAQIVKNYIDSKSSEADKKSLRELFQGIIIFFDRALGPTLLYENERDQYDTLDKTDRSMAEIYGAEHLLRLFVRLPKLLSHASLSEAETKQLQSKLSDFLKFLQKNHTNWFLSSYVPSQAKENTATDVTLSNENLMDTKA